MKTAKWKGAPFEVEDGEDEGGPRNLLHEYPGRDDPDGEALGKLPKRFTITGHLIDSDEGRLERKRKALEAKTDEPGPGTLEHPKHGSITCIITGPVRFRYSTREGGMYRVTLELARVGKPKSPGLSIDTGLAAVDAASAALDAIQDALTVGPLDLSGFDYVQKGANAILAGPRSLTRALKQVNARTQRAIGTITDLSTAIDDFAAEVGTLLDTPGNLALALRDLINSVVAAVGLVERKLLAGDAQPPELQVGLAMLNLESIGKFGDQTPAVEGDTPSRQRQRDNQALLIDSIEGMALAETVVLLTDLEIPSEESADDALERVGAIFDRIQYRGTVDDEVSRRLLRLRAQFHLHMRRVSVDLTGLERHTPPAAISAIQLAWNLYGDASREAEIVARNRPERPGYMHAGVELGVARE